MSDSLISELLKEISELRKEAHLTNIKLAELNARLMSMSGFDARIRALEVSDGKQKTTLMSIVSFVSVAISGIVSYIIGQLSK